MTDENAERQANSTRCSWRRFWKWVCVGSACLALVLLMISGALSSARGRAQPSSLFLVLDGLLALFQIIAIAVTCVAAIGWVFCRPSGGRVDQQ